MSTPFETAAPDPNALLISNATHEMLATMHALAALSETAFYVPPTPRWSVNWEEVPSWMQEALPQPPHARDAIGMSVRWSLGTLTRLPHEIDVDNHPIARINVRVLEGEIRNIKPRVIECHVHAEEDLAVDGLIRYWPARHAVAPVRYRRARSSLDSPEDLHNNPAVAEMIRIVSGVEFSEVKRQRRLHAMDLDQIGEMHTFLNTVLLREGRRDSETAA